MVGSGWSCVVTYRSKYSFEENVEIRMEITSGQRFRCTRSCWMENCAAGGSSRASFSNRCNYLSKKQKIIFGNFAKNNFNYLMIRVLILC